MNSVDPLESRDKSQTKDPVTNPDSSALLAIITQLQSKFIKDTDIWTLFDDLVIDLLALTDSDFGYVGEVLYKEDGQPFLTFRGLTNIAWNPETQALYDQMKTVGLEFHNMDTIYGAGIVNNGSAVISNDPARDPRRGGFPEGHPKVTSFMGLPVYSEGQLVGQIAVSNRPGGYTEELADFLQPLLQTCGSIIQAYRNERTLQKSLEREKLLTEIVESIRAETDLKTILQRTVHGLGTLTHADRCVIWLQDSDSRKFRLPMAEYHSQENVSPISSTTSPDAPFFSLGLNQNRTAIVPDITEVTGLSGEDQRIIRERGIKSLLHVPILYKDMLLGVLRVHSVFEEREWDYDTVQLVEQIAAQAAVAIYLAKTLQEAQESNARKSAILDSALDAVLTINHAGEIVEWNPAAERIFGYSRDEAIGQDLAKLIIPEQYRQSHYQGLERYLATGKALIMNKLLELSAIRRDGTEFPVELTISRTPSEGSPLFTGTLRDITERKRIEAELLYQNHLTKAITNNMTSALLYLDNEQRATYVNPAWEKMTGYTLEEMQGQIAHNMVHHTHPDGRPFPMDECPIDQALPDFKPVREYEAVFVHKDGHFYDVVCNAEPIFRDGVPEGTVVEAREITQEKLAKEALQKGFEREQALRRIVEIVNQSFDLNVTLAKTAKAVGAFFKADRCFVVRYTERDQHLSVQISASHMRDESIPTIELEDFPPDILEMLTRNLPIEQAMRMQNFTRPAEYIEDLESRIYGISQLSDAEKKRYIDTLMKILIEKYRTRSILRVGIYYRGIPYGVITLHQCDQERVWTEDEIELLQDIATQLGIAMYQAELYQQEQQARQAAEGANKKKSEFLAMMSHELRTPLNSIIGYSRMIELGKAGSLTEKQQRYISNVGMSGNHLLNIVNDLLDISKVQAGKMVISPGFFQLEDVISEVRSMMITLAGKSNVRLFFEIQPDINGIEADPARFKQILINLISNAIKFNDEQGSVWIRLHKSDDKQWLIGEIEDTGIGIPKNQQKELFNKFYQADVSYSRKHEGTGLGLALTKELIELHGGFIKFESTEGVGTTFRFQIPTRQPQKENEAFSRQGEITDD